MSGQIISGLIIGVVVAAASALVSHLLLRSRERERWEREERRQREAWERETQAQHRADRLELYRKFLADVSRMGMESEQARAAWERAEQAWAEIELLGSAEVREAADHLFPASTLKADLENTLRSYEDTTGENEAWRHNRRELDRIRENLLQYHDAFVEAVRRELGVDTDLRGQ